MEVVTRMIGVLPPIKKIIEHAIERSRHPETWYDGDIYDTTTEVLQYGCVLVRVPIHRSKLT